MFELLQACLRSLRDFLLDCFGNSRNHFTLLPICRIRILSMNSVIQFAQRGSESCSHHGLRSFPSLRLLVFLFSKALLPKHLKRDGNSCDSEFLRPSSPPLSSWPYSFIRSQKTQSTTVTSNDSIRIRIPLNLTPFAESRIECLLHSIHLLQPIDSISLSVCP